MKLRDRLHWILRMSLLLFILSSVAFLSALTAMRFAVQGREVAMPNVVGMKAAQAQQLLAQHGIGIRIEDRLYSTVPVDGVLRQSPQADMQVKVGQNAHVVLSLGPQKVTIPQLEEKSVRAAQIEMLRDGLQLGEVSSAHLPEYPEDVVIEQDPTPSTTRVTSPHVDVLVSLGPPPPAYVMPSLIGLQAAEAESKLNAAGLKVAKLASANVPDAVHGAIIDQSPARGQRVDPNTPIELQVAD
ncbi:MAG TPA: PASTA domain-containing protein [Candidatus Acidoferrales bacterium]|jgi:serine/threonine-protein kinase|nr:PASTA domain-containing protein [Candidatus Acidoferrales bacterium]